MMDNRLLSIFFFFLPFNFALTLNVGFPLKISEIVIFVYGFLLLLRPKIRIIDRRSLLFFSINVFVFLSLVSVGINLYYEYNYPLNSFISRFGYKFDSVLKYFYVLLSYFAFIITTNAYSANQNRYYKNLMKGTLLASAYCWYLFVGSFLGIDLLFLPGMEEYPQSLNFNGREIIRCGTMKEGNYMGLFLFFSAVIAMYKKDERLGLLFFATTLTTLSTMGIGCSFIFLLIFYVRKYYSKYHFLTLAKYLSFLTVLGIVLLSFEEIRFVLLNKITADTDAVHSDNTALSKADRMNSFIAAVNLGIDNPVWGVGLSNYALHYVEYYPDPYMYEPGFKNIINNIYAEVFAENGALCLAFFLLFLLCLFRRTDYDKSYTLRIAFCLNLVYFLTFPSFTMLYVWAFWGFIASLKYNNEQSAAAIN